jgi:hypothetical protein
MLEDRTAPAVFPVTSLADSGPGTFRQAILVANVTPGDDAITFGVTGIISLASALPDLSTNIDIAGPGANLLTVRRDTGGNYRILTVKSGAAVTLSGLTISNGGGADATDSIDGPGILNTGTLTLSNSTVSGNLSWNAGGGIDNGGTLTLNKSIVSGNLAYFGGGIHNSGALTLNNSTVSGNGGWAWSFGGGILNVGTATVTNSTISGNYAGEYGGGIYDYRSATLTLTNSTVSSNLASSGGGIWNSGTLHTRNTIIAGSSTDDGFGDLAGNLGSWGYNLIGSTSGGSGFDPTDLLNVDPRLGPLQDNGGPTFTRALLPGSPAINAGDNSDSPPFDQRGLERIVGGRIDIGAYELQSLTSTTTSLASSANPSVYGQAVTFTATVAAVSPGAGTPTGKVTFKYGSTILGTRKLDASGRATFTTSSLRVGRRSITVVYTGSTNYRASTSAKLTQTVRRSRTPATQPSARQRRSQRGEPPTPGASGPGGKFRR